MSSTTTLEGNKEEEEVEDNSLVTRPFDFQKSTACALYKIVHNENWFLANNNGIV